MAQTTISTPTRAAWVPDRRRKHFPTNGGPKPSETDRERARRGLDAAREALRSVEPTGPSVAAGPIERHTPEQAARARAGLAAARTALHSTT